MPQLPRLVLTEAEKRSIGFAFAGCILLIFVRVTVIFCWHRALRRGLYTHRGFAIPISHVVIGGQQERAVVANATDVQFLNLVLDTTRRHFGPGPEATSIDHFFYAKLATGQRTWLSFSPGGQPDTATFRDENDFFFHVPHYRRRIPGRRPKGFKKFWRFLLFPKAGAKLVWH